MNAELYDLFFTMAIIGALTGVLGFLSESIKKLSMVGF